MTSKILSSSYFCGTPIRFLRRWVQTGQVPQVKTDRSLKIDDNISELQGFSALRQLSNYAEKNPNLVLINDRSIKYTASEIYKNVLKLAQALKKECKIKVGNSAPRIAIMTMAEREMFEAFFACQAIGAVPVPINFVNRPKTIAFMFADSGAQTLIVGKDKRLIQGAKKLASLGFLKNVISVESNTDYRFYNYNDLLNTENELSDLSFIKHPKGNYPGIILYTSGTEKAPRGVVYPLQAIAHATDSTTKNYDFTSSDKFLFPLPFYHLAGFISFLGAMYPWKPEKAGCELVLTDIPRYKEPETIENALNDAIKNKITIFPGAPLIVEALLEKTLEYFEKTNDKKHLLTDLRLIISGGAPISKKQIRLLRKLNELRNKEGVLPVELETFYACTEFGPISGGKIDLSNEEDPEKRLCLGHTFNGIKVRTNKDGILEAQSNYPLDHYLNRESSLLLWDDFTQIGDKIKVEKNGSNPSLFYLGRSRGSYNIRGNEVSPEESQNLLEKINGIDSVCVFGVEDKNSNGHVLCAFIIKKNNLSGKDLDKLLEKAGLPSRLRPSIYFFEERIPQEIINGSSKITPSLLEKIYEGKVASMITENSNLSISNGIEEYTGYLSYL